MTQTTGELNLRWAFALMDGLAVEGLRHVVISPGSRSTPLVLAAEHHPDLTTHVVLDERSAGFYAIGIGKGTGMPVALVCTSGTATANWHPAVLEAEAGKIRPRLPRVATSRNEHGTSRSPCCAHDGSLPMASPRSGTYQRAFS